MVLRLPRGARDQDLAALRGQRDPLLEDGAFLQAVGGGREPEEAAPADQDRPRCQDSHGDAPEGRRRRDRRDPRRPPRDARYGCRRLRFA